MYHPALLSSALIVLAASNKHHQCQCGAVADPVSGLCRKCQSRRAWHRRTTQPRRKSNRRRMARRVHDVARFLVGFPAQIPVATYGLES
jgi:hypothetical protein